MKPPSLVFGIALVALISIVAYVNLRKNDTFSAKDSATPHGRLESDADSSRVIRPPVASTSNRTRSERDDIERLRRELKSATAQLERITRPLGQDVLSSTVNAEINPGETLVTGGYMTADGNYELTLLTPRSIVLDDGREAIEIGANILSVGSAFAEAHGLETLTTNARNTLQHVESWMHDDVTETLRAANDAEGVALISSPKVVALSSTSFTVSIGEVDGAQFSIEGSATKNPSGSFSIQSRVERTPATEGADRQE